MRYFNGSLTAERPTAPFERSGKHDCTDCGERRCTEANHCVECGEPLCFECAIVHDGEPMCTECSLDHVSAVRLSAARHQLMERQHAMMCAALGEVA